MAFIFTTNSRGGSNSANKNSTLNIYEGNKKLSDGTRYAPQVAISISDADMEKNRWVINDRVDVGFDDENPRMVLIKRSQKGGFAISHTLGVKAYGQQLKGVVKFTMSNFPFAPGTSFECKKMEITREGSIFTFE